MVERIVVAEWKYGKANKPVNGRVPRIVNKAVKRVGADLPLVQIGHLEGSSRSWWLHVRDGDGHDFGVSSLEIRADKGMRPDERDKRIGDDIDRVIIQCAKGLAREKAKTT
jgi:hypothetical protein